MGVLTLHLDDLEEDHLKRAVLAHYARTMLATVEPGLTAPSEANREAAQSLYGKVESVMR